MSVQKDARAERTLRIALDLGERIFMVLLYATFVVRLSHTLVGRPYNLLILVPEGLDVLFIIIRRNAVTLTIRPWDWTVAFAGTALPMLVQAGGHPLLPSLVGAALILVGLSLEVLAKLTLRRSFGIAAANRGLVHAGLYRFVRHPIYAGYFLVFAGYLLNNPLVWNLAIYALAFVSFIARILAEEALLTRDPDYAAYRIKVRYRLLPGLF